MTFSPMIIAGEIDWPGKVIEGHENIKVVEVEGEKYLILSEAQYTELANHIEQLKADKEKYKAQLEQAKKEVEKAYDTKPTMSFDDLLTGAGLASLLILITQQTD